MFEYLVKRIATLIPTLIFVSMLIFGLQQLLPGDPAKILAGEDQTRRRGLPAHQAASRRAVAGALCVLGRAACCAATSASRSAPSSRCSDLVLQKLPVTLELALLAFAIALIIGIPAGIVSAVGRYRLGFGGQHLCALGLVDAQFLGSAS